jgi:hypothetical protein
MTDNATGSTVRFPSSFRFAWIPQNEGASALCISSRVENNFSKTELGPLSGEGRETATLLGP